MLRATEIKPDVYWVGGIDWTERNFHGYTTDRGSTYNAYLILDERSPSSTRANHRSRMSSWSALPT